MRRMDLQVIAILLLLIISAFTVAAANDPGHDSLYVLRIGDTNITGSINLTGNVTAALVRVSGRFFGDNLDIRADGSSSTAQNFIRATATDLEIGSGAKIILNGGGTAVQVGTVAAPAILNVTGSIYQGNVLVCLANGTNCPVIGGSSTAGGWQNTSTVVSLVTATNNISAGALTVDNTNTRVGINTSNPQSPLHINVSGGDTFMLSTSGSQGLWQTFQTAGSVRGYLGVADTAGTADAIFTDELANALSLRSQGALHLGSGTGADLTIDTDGDIGIGTTSPTQKLDVNGSINVSGTISVGTSQVCLANGTNCPASGAVSSAAGWQNTSALVSLVDTTDNVTIDTVLFDSTNDRVGIGTTSPSQLLHLNSSSTSGTQLVIQSADTGGSAWRLISTASGSTGGAGNLGFYDGSNYRMYINGSSGYVGIGTTSPTGQLHVAGNSLNAYFTSNSGATTGYSRVFVNNDAAIGTSIVHYGSAFAGTSTYGGLPYANLSMITGHGNAGLVLTTNGDIPLVLGTSDEERIRITATGNVGVGNTSPANRLTVQASGSDTIPFGVTNSSGSTMADVRIGSAGNPQFRLFNSSSSQGVELHSSGSSYFTGGNVGIGTTTPAQKLHVYSTTDGLVKFVANGSTINAVIEIQHGNDSMTESINFLDAGGSAYGQIRYSQAGSNMTFRTAGVDGVIIDSTGKVNSTTDFCITGGNCLSTVSSSGGGWTDDGTAVRLTTSTDSVGIGTASPTTKFEINGTTYTTPQMKISGGGTALGFNNTGGAYTNWIIGSQWNVNNGFEITPSTAASGSTFSTPAFTILSSGNVGVGTAAPSARLEINGSSSNEIARFTGNNGTTGVYTVHYDGANAATRGFIGYGSTLFTGGSISDFGIRSQGGVALGTAGSINLYINSSTGYVGLGTASPLHPLEIVKTTTEGLGIRVVNQNGPGITFSDNVDDSYQIRMNSSGDLKFLEASVTERMVIKKGGNVGIGTTTPDQKLEVSSVADNAHMMVKLHAPTDKYAQLGYYENSALKWNLYNDFANDNFVFGNSGGGRVYIDQSGNLGVSTSPSAKLHVQGADLATFTTNNAYGPLLVTGGTYAAGDVVSMDFRPSDYTVPFARIGSQFTASGSYLHFGTSNNYGVGITNTAMTIDYSGNVGVGTPSPGTPLHVVGRTFISSVNSPGNPTGTGVIITYKGDAGWNQGIGGYIHSYDYTGGVYKPLTMDGLSVLLANGGTTVVNVSGNNVGIGVTAPDAKLDVQGGGLGVAGRASIRGGQVSNGGNKRFAQTGAFAAPRDMTQQGSATGLSDSNDGIFVTSEAVTGWDQGWTSSTSYARRAGRVMEWTVNTTGVSTSQADHMMIGWGDGTTMGVANNYDKLIYATYFSKGVDGAYNICIYEDGNSRGCPYVATWGDTLHTMIVLRSTGAYYYMKKNNNANWELIYTSAYSSETPLYPQIAHYSGRFTIYDMNVYDQENIISHVGDSLLAVDSGNVAIGTTTATDAKLTIMKDSTYNSEGTGGIKIVDTTGTATALLMGVQPASSLTYIQSIDPGTSYATEYLALNPNGGNVGVGMIAPSNAFHVTGNIGATGWIGAGCEGACETGGGYALLRDGGYVDLNGATLYGISGGYLRAGSSATVGNVDGAGDLIIQDELEVDGAFYADGTATIAGATTFGTDLQIKTDNGAATPGYPWMRSDGDYLVINPDTSATLYLTLDAGGGGTVIGNGGGAAVLKLGGTNSATDPGYPWMRSDGNYLVINPKTSSDLYLAWDAGATVYSGALTRIGTGGTLGYADGAGDLYVQDELEVDGSFYGPGADLAELINTSEELEAGDVVIADTSAPEAVKRSTTAYNTKVVGVIATAPGIILSKDHGDVPLALSGRVPIKVSAENGAIEPGDLLTTSSIAGHAMRCESAQACQGAIVAKSLGRLESGTGLITGLVMLG